MISCGGLFVGAVVVEVVVGYFGFGIDFAVALVLDSKMCCTVGSVHFDRIVEAAVHFDTVGSAVDSAWFGRGRRMLIACCLTVGSGQEVSTTHSASRVVAAGAAEGMLSL